MKYIDKIKRNKKTVQSFHPCKSVIETNYDIVKTNGGELKVDSKQGEATDFKIVLRL